MAILERYEVMEAYRASFGRNVARCQRGTLRFQFSIACLLGAALPVFEVGAADSPAPVRVVQAVAAHSGRTLRLTGTVTAGQRARLSPRVSGLVATMHVDAGDQVEKGDVLVDLDRILAELAVRRTQAALDEARARLAEADRLEAEAAALLEDQFIPESEVLARSSTVRLNRAATAKLDAEAREARELVERHSVIAPFAGVIARKLTESGEWVETGTPVLELVGSENLRLDVQVPQERFADIEENMAATVRLDGRPDRPMAGRVAAKVPVNDPGARTFLVRVLLDDIDGSTVPGMSGEASLAIRGQANAVAVPRDALVRAPDGTDRVWVVERGDGATRAVARAVRIGRSLAETVEVVDGLAIGLSVVVRGNETLREGQPVRVLAED
jgi:RND family efflux transporter MFP subunit